MASGMSLHIFPPPQKPQRLQTGLNIVGTQSMPVPKVEISKSPDGMTGMVFELPVTSRSPTVDPVQVHFPDSPYREHWPSPATSETQRMMSPELEQDRRAGAVSPAFSESQSARSGSPTLIRSNSGASARTAFSSKEPPLMQSIFPTYNPNVPLSAQQYRPLMHSSSVRIPPEKFSRASYSSEVVASGSSSAVQFTPLYELQELWNVANGIRQEGTTQIFALQMHRPKQSPTSKKSPKPSSSSEVGFGLSSLEPFFSMTHSGSSLFNGKDHDTDQAEEDEILIRRHHPMVSKSLPVAHFAVNTPQPFHSSPSSRHSGSPGSETDSYSLVATVYPKLAALAALDAAGNSPAASSIAQFDPSATSPAAQRLAEDAVRGAAERESCSLVWVPASSGTSSGRYELHHPSLGIFQISVTGDVQAGLRSTSSSNIPTPSPKTQPKPARIELHAPTRSAADSNFPPRKDSVWTASLATLDLAKDALFLNVGELQRLGNPFIIDAAVSTLLAVAVAESRREQAVAEAFMFAGPPSATMAAAAAKEAAKQIKRETKAKKSLDSKFKGKGKAREITKGEEAWDRSLEKEEMPRLTKGILSGLNFGFTATVWMLDVGIKLASGAVVVVSKCVSNKK